MTDKQPQPNPLDELLWLAHRIGQDPKGLVVLGEGSVSARLDDKRFLVKSAGAALAELTPGEVTECNTEEMIRILEMPLLDTGAYERMIREAQMDPSSRPPTSEAPIHAWLHSVPGINFVAHCQPEALLQILCSPAAPRFAEHRMYPAEVEFIGTQVVIIPYADPGTPLAREIRSKYQASQRRTLARAPRLILVQNYGVLAFGDSARSVLSTLLMAEKSARIFVGASRLGGPIFLPPQHVARLEARMDEGPRASTIKL
jgi:ribulose-5-phosphate 4-epimerase/fuculose-1-phosphate aldolase